jgi:hypothetical protein
MEQLAALEVVVRNQQFTIGGHEAIAREAIAIAERAGVVPYELVDRAAALGNRPTAADAAHWLSSALAALSIPPATDPPREAVQKAELDAIHERFWSSVAPEAVHPDSVRLDWWLLDSQPDGFGEHSIWDLVPPDEMDDAAYLRAARAAMDAAAMQAPQAQETK